MREKIVTKMFECENKVVYKQYVRSMTTICRFDYPEKWPNLLTGDITNALNSGNEKGIVTGLQALWCLTKKYEFEIEEDREPLFPIMQHALNLIGGIIDTYMGQTENEIALKIMHLVGKCFYNSNQLYLCPFLQEGDALAPWMMFFKTLLDNPLPAHLESATEEMDDIAERDKSIHWKIKGISAKITYRIFSKYASTRYLNEGTPEMEFNNKFQVNYGEMLLESHM